MKYRYFLFFALLFLCPAMAIRGQEKVTLTVWDSMVAQSKFYNAEIKLFQEKYPWIEIKRVTQVVHKYRTIVEMAARSGSLPDLYFPSTGYMNDDAINGWIIPLDKWATPAWKKRFPKGSFTQGIHIFNGKTFSLPAAQPYVWHQLYINRKVFRDAGLVDKSGKILHPRTWAEYRKFAKIITEKGKGKVWGVGIAKNPSHMYAHIYYEWARWAGAAGGDHVEPFEMDYRAGKYTFDHPAYLKVFKLLLDLKKDGSLIPNFLSIEDEVMRAMFAEGQIGMIDGGVWNQNGWAGTHPGWNDYDCAPEPAPDEKGYRAMQCVIAEPSCYLISRDCKNPDAAWLFLDWLTTPEAGKRFVKLGIGISIFPEANVPENAKTEQYAQFLKICSKFLRWAPNPMARNAALANIKLDTPIPSREEVFWGILSGQIAEKDIPKAMKDMNDRYNAELAKQMKKLQEQGIKLSMKDLLYPDWNPLENYGE
ncbi:MAG: extracellular solute-binding protein [Bacillota bacterium]